MGRRGIGPIQQTQQQQQQRQLQTKLLEHFNDNRNLSSFTVEHLHHHGYNNKGNDGIDDNSHVPIAMRALNRQTTVVRYSARMLC
jgi:hypothetical protein